MYGRFNCIPITEVCSVLSLFYLHQHFNIPQRYTSVSYCTGSVLTKLYNNVTS